MIDMIQKLTDIGCEEDPMFSEWEQEHQYREFMKSQEDEESAETDESNHGLEFSDIEADSMTLADAGWGTDEDYGCFGDCEF